ncbi:dihydrodipicolinate synthase family protein [Microbacterium soli]
MTELRLGGVVVAMVTPFQEDESLDIGAIEAYADRLASEDGVTGLLACGYSGELQSLSEEEHVAVVRAVAEGNAGRLPIIAGLFPTSTRHTIAVGERLRDAGADVLQINSPFYNQLRRGYFAEESIGVQFFTDLADALDMPMSVFQYSDGSGLRWPVSTIARLAEIPQVIAIKEAGQMETYAADYEAVQGRVGLFADNNTYSLLGMLQYGTAGTMIGLGQVCLPLWLELYELTSTGRFTEAVAHTNEKLVPLINIFTAELGTSTYSALGRIKEALVQLQRIPGNTVRRPEPAVTEAEKALIARVLRSVGALD